MDMDPEQVLEKIGLSPHEAKVYVALLELGLTSSQAIIEKTNLHRQIVYDSLHSLIEKGIVSFIVLANRRHFKAAEPKQIVEYLNKKQEEIEQQKKEFCTILPVLEVKKERKREEQETTVFAGNKGISSLFDDMLNQKEEILTLGASDLHAEAFQYHVRFNLPKFHKVRIENKIVNKLLFSEEMQDRAKELNKLKYTEVKLLPKEFTSNSSTNIFGDKVSLIMWGSQSFGILIRSKEIAEAQRRHFQLLWKTGKNA